MEFLRFGSSIPGSYWGCCAADIIQNFKVEPDAPYAISLVDGDGGNALGHPKGGQMYVGMTYREVFKARIRFGTFGSAEMPNHAFFAILTESQISGGVGKKWLEILRQEGFEFIRTVDNSVYTGNYIIPEPGKQTPGAHKNYVFALFRNIGIKAVSDQFTPPKAWTSLPRVNSAPEMWEVFEDQKGLTEMHQKDQLAVWNAGTKPAFYTKAEVEAKCPGAVWLAGERSTKPQRKAPKPALETAAASPFAKAKGG